MTSPYLKRSENRNQLRFSQTRLVTSGSVQSRNSSRKKYIEVYSKRSNQLEKQRTQSNLKDSVMSLPIRFDQNKNNLRRTSIQISKSQINLHPPPYQMISRNHPPINQINNFHARGYSLPTKTIIIREVIKPIPVNFSYLHPHNVRIQPQPSNRMSLPISIPNKCQIIKSQQARLAAAPIRLFSNVPNMYQIPKRQSTILSNINNIQIQNSRNNVTQKRPSMESSSITFLKQSNNTVSNMRTSQVKVTNESIQKNERNKNKMLDNQSYIEFQIKLKDIAVNTEAPSLKTSILQSREQSRSQSRIVRNEMKTRQQYCSVIVTKQDEQQYLKQNLELKQKQYICEKIKNINQIKINKKQSLKPKKNFVFI